jgi:hypothetical protein
LHRYGKQKTKEANGMGYILDYQLIKAANNKAKNGISFA